MNIEIKKINSDSPELPLHLLLSADPSEGLVKEYLPRGLCYIANVQAETIGILPIPLFWNSGRTLTGPNVITFFRHYFYLQF